MRRFNPSAEKLGRSLKNGCKEIQLAKLLAEVKQPFRGVLKNSSEKTQF